MVLDLDQFRQDKGGDSDKIRDYQRMRYKDPSLVDKVIENDANWRQARFNGDKLNTLKNICSKEIGLKIKNNKSFEQDVSNTIVMFSVDNLTPEVIKSSNIPQIKTFRALIDDKIKENDENLLSFNRARLDALAEIGNVLHPSVPVSDNEEDNEIVLKSGNLSLSLCYSHVDLIQMIDGVDTQAGPIVAGGRGFYLKGACVLLQNALVQFALHKWFAKDYQPIYPPFFMRKEIMHEVAQLSQFDEELYKVIGKSSEKVSDRLDEEKYLIATSEQPLAALHRGQWISEASLPIRYLGQSTCFRQEVGSHGRDTAGIFRVHQFEKIEQFVLTSPLENKSWEMMDEMMNNCMEFYSELGIAFRVVNIVSGALNNSAAKKLDLEAWFPGSKTFRELVSCSNCLDYQARRLLIRFGQTKKSKGPMKFVHMLNATACATTRVICAILETHQMKNGIVIPPALRKFFPPGYPEVIPYVRPHPDMLDKGKK